MIKQYTNSRLLISYLLYFSRNCESQSLVSSSQSSVRGTCSE